jgi:glycosyltransferase involved in cell wall biosynthesis
MKISEKLNATCILPTLSKTRFKPRESTAKTSQTVVLGWTGTFSSKKYLELIIPQLESLSKKVDFKLLVIGNFSFDHAFLNIEVLQWSEAEEIRQLHRIDIGLYPLPNDKWITGKSGLKTLQYMAIGLPSVSSKYGNINNIISHEIDGFLVENNEEWIERLEQLILDQSYRKLMGENAKRKFDSCFSQDINQKKYLDILETVT